MARSSLPGSRRRLAPGVLMLGAAAVLAVAVRGLGARSSCWVATGALAGSGMRCLGPRQLRSHVGQPRTQVHATVTDTFDPWTVLGIAPGSGIPEARKAYRKLIAKYHPDVDPSKEAEEQFQKIVRAHALVTGEDKELDMPTMLRNAVENLRNDLEFKKQQIADLKAKAVAEEEAMMKMEEQLEQATSERDKVTQELGAYGGATLGFLAGGPAGLVIGAVLGLTLREREDAVGQVIRGTGTVTKGFVTAVGKVIEKQSNKA